MSGRPVSEALLAQMQRVIPFEAGFIALLPPGESAHVPLIRHGYDERTNGHLDSPEFLQDLELGGPRRTRRPLSRRLPADRRGLRPTRTAAAGLPPPVARRAGGDGDRGTA
jgi:hypothetical protein